MALAIAACLGWAVTTWILVSALKEKDRHHSLHVSGLLNRIQAPEATVTQELTGAEEHETMILPHDEKSYWAEIHHLHPEDAA